MPMESTPTSPCRTLRLPSKCTLEGLEANGNAHKARTHVHPRFRRQRLVALKGFFLAADVRAATLHRPSRPPRTAASGECFKLRGAT